MSRRSRKSKLGNFRSEFEKDVATQLQPFGFSSPQDNHNPVTQPDHYNRGAIEAIEAIKASMHPQEYKGYLKGNCLKYLWRYEYKNGIEDLRKARVYLEWLIKEVAI